MTNIKRIEIVIDAAHTPELLASLRDAGAQGYTVIRDVQGTGDRGDRSGDELTNVFRNCYVIVACEPQASTQIVEAVRPLLRRHGGVCLISDAQWVKH